MLGLSIIIDPVVFMYNLFVDMEKDKLSLDGNVFLTPRGIELFQETCDEVIKSKTQQIKKWDGKINFVEFNLILQQKFDIIEEVRKLIFEHGSDDKYVFNDYTLRTQLNP